MAYIQIDKGTQCPKPSLNPALVPEVNRTYGYLGVKLDTPLAGLPYMKFFERRGELVIYRRPADELQVGRTHVACMSTVARPYTCRYGRAASGQRTEPMHSGSEVTVIATFAT